MKVALLLKGSSIGSYDHWQFGDRVTVNYEHGLENLKSNLIENNNCDVFFHTWKNEDVDMSRYEKMVGDFNAASYVIDEDISGEYGPNLGKKVVTTTKRVIECYNDYVEKHDLSYDLIVLCRFDLYFFHQVRLESVLKQASFKDKVFVYALESNTDNSTIDKETTKDQGIDDNFIIFSPDTLQEYHKALDLKTETVATYRSSEFFNPKQHCSLHHLYYLLNDNIIIKNLVDVFSYTDKQCLYGVVKGLSESSKLISRCSLSRRTKIDKDLFAIHYH